MGLVTGTYAIGPESGSLTLHTGRRGLGATVGHDLVIEVTRWRGTVHVDGNQPEASTVEVVVDATSFEVREGRGGAVPLLAINKSEIVRTINKLLKTDKHPQIRFESSSAVQTEVGFDVIGSLTIVGTTRSLTLTVSVDPTEDQPKGVVTAEVVQTDFGVKPYSAMFGALKVRDMVEVRAEVELPG